MINDTMPISLKGNPTQWGDNIKKYIQDLSNGDNLLSLSQSILGVTSAKDYLMVNPNLGGGNPSIVRNNDYLVSHLIPTTGITSLTIKIKKQLIARDDLACTVYGFTSLVNTTQATNITSFKTPYNQEVTQVVAIPANVVSIRIQAPYQPGNLIMVYRNQGVDMPFKPNWLDIGPHAIDRPNILMHTDDFWSWTINNNSGVIVYPNDNVGGAILGGRVSLKFTANSGQTQVHNGAVLTLKDKHTYVGSAYINSFNNGVYGYGSDTGQLLMYVAQKNGSPVGVQVANIKNNLNGQVAKRFSNTFVYDTSIMQKGVTSGGNIQICMYGLTNPSGGSVYVTAPMFQEGDIPTQPTM